MNPWTPQARPAAAGRAEQPTLDQLVRAVQVVLWSWTWWIVATAATTIGGVARAWRRAAASQGKGRHTRGRELRRAREPYRRLDESKPMEEEGVGHRDTLVAMTAPAGAATVAEREAAAAEGDGSEDEEARVASASDSSDSDSESEQGGGSDSEKENEGGEGSRGASVAWLRGWGERERR